MSKSKLFNYRAPIVAYLNLTDVCNLRCKYCFVDVETKRPDELETEEWISLINDLHKNGCNMVCLMGGEPLIFKDIEVLIDHIHSLGMICDMTSNGYFVPKKIDTVKKIDSLMISLDGDKDGHDKNRGKGSFDKAITAIKVAKDNGMVVRINAVMTKQSQYSIDFLLDLADQYDLYVTFSITAEFPPNLKEEEKNIKLSDDEIMCVYQTLMERKKQGRRVMFSQSTLEYILNYPVEFDRIILEDDDDHAKYYESECPFGQKMFYIDANGDFYPCAALWNSEWFKPKNLRRDGFDGAFDNMANLKCTSCFCPGVPEWNRITSPAGIKDGIKITINQTLSKVLN